MPDMSELFLNQASGIDIEFNQSSACFMADTREPILYVEGDSDKEMIISVFTCFRDNQVSIGGTKEGVKKCVEAYVENGGNKELCRGLVDSDIEPYRREKNNYKYFDCLFFTDTRDLETLLWSTDENLFRRLLVKGGFRKSFKYTITEEKDWKQLFGKFLDAAYQLGIIRLIIEDSFYSSSLGIKVNQMTDYRGKPIPGYTSPYHYYDRDNISMDIHLLINEHLCLTLAAKNYCYEIEDKYDEEYNKRAKEKWNIIRGHDLSRMMMMSLNKWRENQWKDVNDFESTLHQLYNDRLIFKTRVGKEINNWVVGLMPVTA